MVLPLSDEKQKIASAFGKAAKRYDSIAYYQQNSGHQLLDLLASARVNLPAKKVIDVGCGTGFFSQIIKAQGAEVTALDLSSGMLEVARQKMRLNSISVRIWKHCLLPIKLLMWFFLIWLSNGALTYHWP